MDERIGIFDIEILTVERNPPMDCASIGGELLLNDTKWEFRSKRTELSPQGLYRVVGEKDTDAQGNYIRIHDVLGSLKVHP